MKPPLPKWVLKRMHPDFLQALIETEGRDDSVLDREINWVLMQLRFWHAVEPYARIFKLAKEVVSGRYWRAGSKIHGGPHQAPGTCPGPASIPTPQQPYGASLVGAVGGAFTTAAGAGLNVVPATLSGKLGGVGFFEDAGIKAGEVTAYRCWRQAGDRLYSVYQDDVVWNPGEVMEGDADNGEGVHAFKDVVDLARYGSYKEGELVSGQIEMWGTVYEHERGYRSSHAKISAIFDSPFYNAPALRKKYGIDDPATKPAA